MIVFEYLIQVFYFEIIPHKTYLNSIRKTYFPVFTSLSKTFPCTLGTCTIGAILPVPPISIRSWASWGFCWYSLILVPIASSLCGSTCCLELSATSCPYKKINTLINWVIRIELVLYIQIVNIFSPYWSIGNLTFTSSIWLGPTPCCLAAPTSSLRLDPWLINFPINSLSESENSQVSINDFKVTKKYLSEYVFWNYNDIPWLGRDILLPSPPMSHKSGSSGQGHGQFSLVLGGLIGGESRK